MSISRTAKTRGHRRWTTKFIGILFSSVEEITQRSLVSTKQGGLALTILMLSRWRPVVFSITPTVKNQTFQLRDLFSCFANLTLFPNLPPI
ncbi:hypothetical protein Mp_8g13200 [Marchantia polymorpha subsp. ruderalis]|uniref:Uncharacterized protein n=1 Tax=Marchantia polymorpha TaxID=3197 RepID=A0A2R6WJN0_MARPO|nr:hypothetical protein MARPO_0083s0002 [Marchantia polymorpha]BBN19740.1 hypothetical protein Mp_8g13200 [Marchantia polymorpha subsp. ruderalis]|eukprot:PTQ34031.1 hypothetical protein MARPO_0083s0002 [Marchantia polymorpha]